MLVDSYRSQLNRDSMNTIKRLWLVLVAVVVAMLFFAGLAALGGQTLPPMPPGTVPTLKVFSPKFGEQLESWGTPMVYWTQMTPAKLAQLPLMRPKMMFQAPGAAAVVPNPLLKTIVIAWNYPSAQMPLVQFELWYATDLSGPHPPLQHYDSVPLGFTLSLTTRTNIVSILSNLPAQFFIVRAQDLVTGVYSYWNQLVQVAVTNTPMKVSMVSPPDGSTVSGTITLTATVTTTYYVDCVYGNDANNGLSISTAWKTPQWANVGPGDRLTVIRPYYPTILEVQQ